MAKKKVKDNTMLKYKQEEQLKYDNAYSDYKSGPRTSSPLSHAARAKIAKELRIKPTVPEPSDPKPKLYRIDWINADNEHQHRYVAAIDKVIAATLFEKKYARGQEIHNININRVPSEWNVRYPVMWDRIGIAIEETRQEEIAALKAKEKELVVKFQDWKTTWREFWQTLSKSQEDDFNMWQALRKVKCLEWLDQWVEIWSDIGQTKWDNRTMFDFIEVD